MDDKPDKPKRRWPTYLAIVILLLLVVYPLSYGPEEALRFHTESKALHDFAEVFYLPLGIVVEATGTNEWFMAYAQRCTSFVEITLMQHTRSAPR